MKYKLDLDTEEQEWNPYKFSQRKVAIHPHYETSMPTQEERSQLIKKTESISWKYVNIITKTLVQNESSPKPPEMSS